jgi:metal-sulfur cluster biosynthetic enzyme
MDSQVFNPNPTIFATTKPTASRRAAQARRSLWLLDGGDNSSDYDSDGEAEPIDADEIFGVIFLLSLALISRLNGALVEDLIRTISDPEHRSMTLEQLAVVSAPQVTVTPNHVLVEFTPTVPHCGMSTLIGLSIRVRLLRALPTRFKVDIRVKPGSHQSEHAGPCFRCGRMHP